MQDQFLEALLSIVHNNQVTFSITLTTPGGLIRGTLISTKEYFDRFAEAFASAWPGENREVLRTGLSQWGEERFMEGDVDAFIHLKDAHFLNGDGSYTKNSEVLWRGRVADVSGYSLGRG
ncbi:gas vesicle accessory protein GvpU [Pseudomonas taiwanensis]|uniref:gas vesicle accessory protein GvpU n=1 Tax=Pseudomonas taiwanensis TaxID=470150 RepID=UPI00164776D8|nr:gas vesicle accessory protein GvpU [Pseudomonas taiwanensis]MBC3492705.1 hypothetical protein [Pseudomonas taiwanensis]